MAKYYHVDAGWQHRAGSGLILVHYGMLQGPHLYHSVQIGDCVEHGLPLRQVGDVQEVLWDAHIGALQTSLDTLWGLVGELDGGLKNNSTDTSEDY